MRYILASASPRRKELLAEIIPEFEVIPSRCEEDMTEDNPGLLVQKLAELKARDVYNSISIKNDAVVIGADTVVCAEGRVLGKPSGVVEAVNMLRSLAGKVHKVYTGVCIIGPYEEHSIFTECTDIHVSAMTDSEIWNYVNGKNPMDKAGAYGIQDGFGARYISRIEGDYYNVVGLPVNRLYHELKRLELIEEL